MDDQRCEQFFLAPCQTLQRHYEALRAFFVERRPLPDIARQFGFTHGTLRNLVCQFRARCQADRVPPFRGTGARTTQRHQRQPRRSASRNPRRCRLPHARAER